MGEFYLSKETPLPPEVDEPLRFIRDNTYDGAKFFWPNQSKRVMKYAAAAQGIQDLWNKETPPPIRSATGKLRSVALTALLQNFGLKESRWMTQFAYGSPSLETYPRGAFILGTWTSFHHLRRISSGRNHRDALHHAQNTPATFTPENYGAKH